MKFLKEALDLVKAKYEQTGRLEEGKKLKAVTFKAKSKLTSKGKVLKKKI